MRGRASCIAAIVTTLVLAAAPAMALETKPTTPPTVVEAPPPSPYIEAVRYTGGNGDVTPDPGERLNVFFSLRNTTEKTMSGVTGTLVIKDPSVTVLDATASWPDIAAGGLEESTTPFVIQIAGDAKRAEQCAGGPIALPAPGSVAPGSDTPVSSDGGTVSSDGNTSSGSSSGSAGAPTSVPGSEPGSAQPPAGTVEPDGSVAPQPAIVEPAPSGSTKPEPIVSTEPAPGGSAEPGPGGSVEPAPDATAPVPFSAAVNVRTSDGSFDTEFVSGVACPLALGAGTAGGTGEVAPVADRAAAAKTTSSSSAPFVIAVIVVAAGALVARYRFTL